VESESLDEVRDNLAKAELEMSGLGEEGTETAPPPEGGLTPEKKRRLEELRAKKAQEQGL